jgi:hypothetical protein
MKILLRSEWIVLIGMVASGHCSYSGGLDLGRSSGHFPEYAGIWGMEDGSFGRSVTMSSPRGRCGGCPGRSDFGCSGWDVPAEHPFVRIKKPPLILKKGTPEDPSVPDVATLHRGYWSEFCVHRKALQLGVPLGDLVNMDETKADAIKYCIGEHSISVDNMDVAEALANFWGGELVEWAAIINVYNYVRGIAYENIPSNKYMNDLLERRGLKRRIRVELAQIIGRYLPEIRCRPIEIDVIDEDAGAERRLFCATPELLATLRAIKEAYSEHIRTEIARGNPEDKVNQD